MSNKNRIPAVSYNKDEYTKAVINSALWAASGDALGWMTELSRDRKNVHYRTGQEVVSQPVDWRRLIGGRGGITVDLPAGTYSDDTQLRLCVSRSIRGDGTFDVETFAKIELTVWQGYSLGAGIGSKAAALNLSKRGVNWFSNFFVDKRQQYTSAGGNGAAMRIQPHVWSARLSIEDMLLSVFRDSIVTHGHPHGFGGALFHSLCLWNTLQCKKLPSIDDAKAYISIIRNLPEIIKKDGELKQIWLPSWERESGIKFVDSLDRFATEALADIDKVAMALSNTSKDKYADILEQTGCLTDKYRGSGFKTALAALALSIIFSGKKIEDALATSANEIRSDTDTIATMAGALLGAIEKNAPSWPIQDRDYLESEALRLAAIGLGENQVGFSYPDVSNWEAPSNQSDTVVIYENDLAIVGLGKLKSLGQEYRTGGFVWQWFELPFGQSILAKRRDEISRVASKNQMPGKRLEKTTKLSKQPISSTQEKFMFEPSDQHERRNAPPIIDRNNEPIRHFPGIDKATDLIISSGFDDGLVGRLINQCIEDTGSIEFAASLTAIIAKAKLARMRRR